MMCNLYEFRLDGDLTAEAREAFCDMRIEDVPPGATLFGAVFDESHLLGILEQCRALGLVVVSAQRLPGPPQDYAPDQSGTGSTGHSSSP